MYQLCFTYTYVHCKADNAQCSSDRSVHTVSVMYAIILLVFNSHCGCCCCMQYTYLND